MLISQIPISDIIVLWKRPKYQQEFANSCFQPSQMTLRGFKSSVGEGTAGVVSEIAKRTKIRSAV